MDKFYLDDYLKSKDPEVNYVDFKKACQDIFMLFNKEWEESQSQKELLILQKKAIMGYEKEKVYFERKISSFLNQMKVAISNLPPWYKSPEEGIYHELWGLAGVAQWFSKEYEKSSSAKIIGENIFFMENGELKLMPQKISNDRKNQLIRAFLLINSDENANSNIHHLYLLDGTRVTVYKNQLTKKEQEVIIFRRYVVTDYSFEEQVRRGTIPAEAIPLFKSMIKYGFNCAFVGQIRSAKTTFLATWQSYENQKLEGVLIETDPEIPLNIIMPNAPIMQLLADDEELQGVVKQVMRSDADYFIIGEARDGIALETAVRVSERGGKRLKMTFHLKEPLEFPYFVADEIANSVGGNVERLAVRAAGAFDYLFFFASLEDKREKRLMGIYELSADRKKNHISVEEICRYDVEKNRWTWKYRIDDRRKRQGMLENRELFQEFSNNLKDLCERTEI